MPFADEHLDGAAAAARRASPCASARRARPRPALRRRRALAREELGALVRADGASGVAGLLDGEVAGFVVGTPRDASWGPNMWVEPAGHAAVGRRSSCATSTRRPRSAGSPTASRCTTRWCRRPIDALVDAWFRLGFGHQQVYAIRETPPATERTAGATGACRPPCSPRRPGRAREARRRACPRTRRFRRSSRAAPLPTVEDARAEYEADFDDPRFTTFVVERDGEVIGSAIACAIEVSSDHKSLALPAGRGLPRLRLGAARGAGLRRGPSARRGGARLGARDGARVGRHRLAHDEPARRRAPGRRLGFRPTFYRLHRADRLTRRPGRARAARPPRILLCACHCIPARACRSSRCRTTRCCSALRRRSTRSPTSAPPSPRRSATRSPAGRWSRSRRVAAARRSSSSRRRCRSRPPRTMRGGTPSPRCSASCPARGSPARA